MTEIGGPSRDDSEAQFGFLAYSKLRAEEGYHAGLLVTDPHGKPVEFRCTTPVRPNDVQRVLYGATLMPYILQELFALPLIRALRSSPRMVVVAEEEFLGARPASPVPLLWARRQGESLQATDEVDRASEGASGLLDSPAGRYRAVILAVHPQYREELSGLQEELRPLFARMDIIEPFDRVRRALEMVEAQTSEHEGEA